MQTEAPRRQDLQAATYREFSRRRYAELKKMNGMRMRESEIIQKIIREWDDMKASKKNKMLNTPLKQAHIMPIPEAKIQHKLRSTKAKQEEEGERKMKMEMMEEVDVQPFDVEDPMPVSDEMPKTRMIKKARKMTPYIAFFKERYATLRLKHPRWSPAELSKIVGLEWKRQKMSMNTSMKSKKNAKAKPMKRMSGRMAFKRFKLKEGMEKHEIINKWRHLPMQSRKMYEMEANPPPSKPTNTLMATRSKANSLNQFLMKK